MSGLKLLLAPILPGRGREPGITRGGSVSSSPLPWATAGAPAPRAQRPPAHTGYLHRLRLYRPARKEEERLEVGGGRGRGKIAPYSTFIKEASSRPKNLMSYFSKKNSCCGTLRPSIFWPELHVVDIG